MSRRELREHIFRLIFRMEFHPTEELMEQKDLYMDHLIGVSDEECQYIQSKADAVHEKKNEIDAKIDEVSERWKTERMTKVDLTVIRLAAYEMLYDEDVPTGVAINEAVELAKRYGTDQSAAFVNGILAKLV